MAELSLWGTGVGDAGAKSLATALKENTTLKNLWLGECEGITDEVRLSVTLKQRYITALAHVHVQGVGGGLIGLCQAHRTHTQLVLAAQW